MVRLIFPVLLVTYIVTAGMTAAFGELVIDNGNVKEEFILVLIAISVLTFYKKDIINNISVVDEQR